MDVSSNDVQAILVRIRKLEKQNRTLKQIGLVVLVIGTAGLLMGQAKVSSQKQATPWDRQVIRVGTIQANKIELVTQHSDPRAELSASPDGSVLKMFDVDGKPLVFLSSSFVSDPRMTYKLGLQPGLTMLDSSGTDSFGSGLPSREARC